MRARTNNRPLTAAALVVLGVLGGSCAIFDLDGRNDRGSLAEARALWEARGIASYDFVLQRSCYCGGGTQPARVIVRDGVRTSVVLVEDDSPLDPHTAALYLTVPELFDFIDDAIDRGAHSIEIRYHATLGYPTSIRIDYDANAIDEEMAFTASDLVTRD